MIGSAYFVSGSYPEEDIDAETLRAQGIEAAKKNAIAEEKKALKKQQKGKKGKSFGRENSINSQDRDDSGNNDTSCVLNDNPEEETEDDEDEETQQVIRHFQRGGISGLRTNDVTNPMSAMHSGGSSSTGESKNNSDKHDVEMLSRPLIKNNPPSPAAASKTNPPTKTSKSTPTTPPNAPKYASVSISSPSMEMDV